MLKFIKDILAPPPGGKDSLQEDVKKRIQIATCVLLLEIATSDEDFSLEEQTTVKKILSEDVGIAAEQLEEILAESRSHRSENVDIWEYTHIVNKNFSHAEKISLIEWIWRVIYADGILNKYEDYMVHKLADLLLLEHDELIAAKLKVKAEF